MKEIPLKTLKDHFAEITAEVAAGTPIEVTKYHKPYLRMVPSGTSSTHYGKNYGKGTLTPALPKAKTKGRYLEILLEDREDRF